MSEIISRHQWTHDGKEVLVVKCVAADGSSYKGFKHPLKVGEVVTAPDWNEKDECGGGIHGWPWCFSLGDGKEPDFAGTWLVYGADPKDVIDLEGKVKFRTGTLRYSGGWHGAMMFVLEGQMAWVRQASSGAATASGDNGAATASGYNGAATASGDNGAATASGTSGAATASGTSGAATASGYNGAATASGYNGAATASGDNGAATASGDNGAATASGDQRSSDGERDQRSSDGERGQRSSDGERGQRSSDGERGQRSSDGERVQRSSDGERGQRSSDGERDQRSSDGERVQRSSDGERDQRSSDGERESVVRSRDGIERMCAGSGIWMHCSGLEESQKRTLRNALCPHWKRKRKTKTRHLVSPRRKREFQRGQAMKTLLNAVLGLLLARGAELVAMFLWVRL